MENLILNSTKSAPGVKFNPNGELLLEGRIILEDVITFFKPIFQWVNELTVSEINLVINLDYLNTSASKHLFILLEKLYHKDTTKSLNITWYYDEDDEDHYDTGKYFEESIEGIKFEFIGVSEVEMAF